MMVRLSSVRFYKAVVTVQTLEPYVCWLTNFVFFLQIVDLNVLVSGNNAQFLGFVVKMLSAESGLFLSRGNTMLEIGFLEIIGRGSVMEFNISLAFTGRVHFMLFVLPWQISAFALRAPLFS